MRKIFDIITFVIAEAKRILAFFLNKNNKKIEETNKSEQKVVENVIKEIVKEKKIEIINDKLGWKEK